MFNYSEKKKITSSKKTKASEKKPGTSIGPDSSALDKLLVQLGIYATGLSSIAYL